MRLRHCCAAWVCSLLLAVVCQADIFRRDNRQLIPGTEAITPGPGVSLAHLDLAFADLNRLDLTGARFDSSNLANASIVLSKLDGATFTGANVAGAKFSGTTSYGFTKEQLYSTASYQEKDLRGIVFVGWFGLSSDLTGWDFSGQDLTGAFLHSAKLSNADLSGACLVSANLLGHLLSGAYLTAADMRGAAMNVGGPAPRNAILFDGQIAGLSQMHGDRMIVRDEDGVPDPSPIAWVAPRAPIPITIHDRMELATGSVLQLLFEADRWDSLISFEPGIPIQLDGALELTFADEVDVATQVGRTLRIFDWTGVTPTGRFQVSSAYHWDTTNLYTTGEVTLIAVPEPWTASLVLVGVITVARSARPRRRHFPNHAGPLKKES